VFGKERSSMSEMKTVPGILDVIRSISANHESGRLDINSFGTHGTLLFKEGKLIDARLESLSGFQAVNAAVSLRDVEFSFDHVAPAAHLSTITPSERVVLKQFFGIDAADTGQPGESSELDSDWNTTPEQVVPFTELEEVPQTELEEMPTREMEPPVPVFAISTVRRSAFFAKPRLALAVCLGLVLLAGLVIGAVTLRSRMKALQQAPSVASAVGTEPSSVPDVPGSVRDAPGTVPDAPHQTQQVAQASPVTAPQRQDTPVRNTTPSPAVASAERPETRDDVAANVQDLTGEWRVINTVQKTSYKSFGNMQVGFRLKINQQGKEFTASGEKFSENGQTLIEGSRTPIHLRGSIDGDKVVATFVEEGRTRRSNGRFVWKLQRGGGALAGTFVTTAANSSGKSAVTRE
jgi:hypothetical protein